MPASAYRMEPQSVKISRASCACGPSAAPAAPPGIQPARRSGPATRVGADTTQHDFADSPPPRQLAASAPQPQPGRARENVSGGSATTQTAP
eukprot:1246396-Rhodomonas_salina.5